jgi:hypothetical protein
VDDEEKEEEYEEEEDETVARNLRLAGVGIISKLAVRVSFHCLVLSVRNRD